MHMSDMLLRMRVCRACVGVFYVSLFFSRKILLDQVVLQVLFKRKRVKGILYTDLDLVYLLVNNFPNNIFTLIFHIASCEVSGNF